MVIRNHYLVLGVSRRENIRGIRDAYRELAKQYHPDRPDAVDRFRDIQEAYEDLSDHEKRRVYDRELAVLEKRRSAARPAWYYGSVFCGISDGEGSVDLSRAFSASSSWTRCSRSATVCLAFFIARSFP